MLNLLYLIIISIFCNLIILLYLKDLHFNFYIINSFLIVLIGILYFIKSNNFIIFIFDSVIIALLLVIFYVDRKHMIIPDFILFLLFCVFLFIKVFNFNFYNINKEEIKLGIVILMFLMLIHILCLNLLKIEIIGFGDLKLLFIFNLFIGFNNVLIILFISSLIACVFEIFILKRKIFPFGPYLILAYLIVTLSLR